MMVQTEGRRGKLQTLDSVEKKSGQYKNNITMSDSDCLPDYPVTSDLVKRLKCALDASDEEGVSRLICTEVGYVDAVIELANDDWMKDPSAQLPPGVLVAVAPEREKAGMEERLPMATDPYSPSYSEINDMATERRQEPLEVGEKLQIFQKMGKEFQGRAGSPVLEYHAALVSGDLNRLEPLMAQFFQDANVVFEMKKDEVEWRGTSSATFGLSGLWTLEYKRELTTPLCIAAARGHTACVRHLLGRGADPDASPGGRGALHEACLGAHTACARLLLRHGADPDLLNAEGLAPLHCCRTAASLG
ncbi:hypothetical protein MC885_020412 [Smutsia gigantea]|nr:hypothetical protein MC885_020412 [Smutsia gigantea]